MRWQIENFRLQKQWEKVLVLEALEVEPLEQVRSATLGTGELVATAKQIRLGNVHQKVQAQFVVVQTIHNFVEKALVEPQRALDFGGYAKFLLQFPHDGLFGSFAQGNPATGQVEVGRTVVLHCQDFAVVNNYCANPVVEFFAVEFERNVHYLHPCLLILLLVVDVCHYTTTRAKCKCVVGGKTKKSRRKLRDLN